MGSGGGAILMRSFLLQAGSNKAVQRRWLPAFLMGGREGGRERGREEGEMEVKVEH